MSDESVTTPKGITVEFRQHDWMPGFAAYLVPEDGSFRPNGEAFCVLNLAAFLQEVDQDGMEPAELASVVADSMIHEVCHVIEHWAGAEFSDERVEALIDRYRGREGQVADAIMDFSTALAFMKAGAKVRRKSWKAVERVLFDPRSEMFWRVDPDDPDHNQPWTPQDGDLMAEDWEIVEDQVLEAA